MQDHSFAVVPSGMCLCVRMVRALRLLLCGEASLPLRWAGAFTVGREGHPPPSLPQSSNVCVYIRRNWLVGLLVRIIHFMTADKASFET